MVAGMLGLLHEPNRIGREVGNLLEDFFSRMLGELEMLWDQTKGIGESSQSWQHRNSNVEQSVPSPQPLRPRTSSASSVPNRLVDPPIHTPTSGQYPPPQPLPLHDQMRQLAPRPVPLPAPLRSPGPSDVLQPTPSLLANKGPSGRNPQMVEYGTPPPPNPRAIRLENIPAQPVPVIIPKQPPVHPSTVRTIPTLSRGDFSPAQISSVSGRRSSPAANPPLNLVGPSQSPSTPLSHSTIYPIRVDPIQSSAVGPDPSSRSSAIQQQHGHHAAKQPLSSNEQPQSSLATSIRHSSHNSAKYEPPGVSSFENLVSSNLLPLPPFNSGKAVLVAGNSPQYFARRCHELRSTVQKMTAGEACRTLSRDERIFWNKLRMSFPSSPWLKLMADLVAVLRKNASVVIPAANGSTAFSRITPQAVVGETLASNTVESGGFEAVTHQANWDAIPQTALDPLETAMIGPRAQSSDSVPNIRRPEQYSVLTPQGSTGSHTGGQQGVTKLGQAVTQGNTVSTETSGQSRQNEGRNGNISGTTNKNTPKSNTVNGGSGSGDAAKSHGVISGITTIASNNNAAQPSVWREGLKSKIAQSSTPAADLLRILNSRQKATPAPATPSHSCSPSEKKKIHLSSGRSSDAHIRLRDVGSPTKVLKGKFELSSSSDTLVASGSQNHASLPGVSSIPNPDLAMGDLQTLKSVPVINQEGAGSSLTENSRGRSRPMNGRDSMRSAGNDSESLLTPPVACPPHMHSPKPQSPRSVHVDGQQFTPLSLPDAPRSVRSPSISIVKTPKQRMVPVVELPVSQKVRKLILLRPPVDRAKVVINVTEQRRAHLIRRGFYGTSLDLVPIAESQMPSEMMIRKKTPL